MLQHLVEQAWEIINSRLDLILNDIKRLALLLENNITMTKASGVNTA